MENLYNSILDWIRKDKKRKKLILFLCRFLPYITAISYIGVIGYTLYSQSSLLPIIIIFPSSVFCIITILRKIWNRPRPYETLSINPLFRNKRGESMPSRHTASAFSIALASYLISPYIGVFLIIIACSIAITRFIAGVHYLSDIVVAILMTFGIYTIFVLLF